MVSLKLTGAATSCFLLLVLLASSSVQPLAAHTAPAAQQGSSYIKAFGQHSTLAVRLAELIEAEEPLAPADVARLAAAVK
jgi:hypothetical protein